MNEWTNEWVRTMTCLCHLAWGKGRLSSVQWMNFWEVPKSFFFIKATELSFLCCTFPDHHLPTLTPASPGRISLNPFLTTLCWWFSPICQILAFGFEVGVPSSESPLFLTRISWLSSYFCLSFLKIVGYK